MNDTNQDASGEGTGAHVDTLRMDEVGEREVDASSADVHVTITGASMLSTGAAARQSKEVAKLASELLQFGVEERALRVTSVVAEVSSGILLRSSSATFGVRVRVANLAQLPDVLGIVTAQKNITMNDVEWRYPDPSTYRADWADELIARANERARRAAISLGVALGGVHRYEESLTGDDYSDRPRGFGKAAPMQQLSRARIDAGMALTKSRTYRLALTIHYRVGRK